MNFAKNIIIDGLLQRQASGWMHQNLLDQPISLYQDGQVFALKPHKADRGDLPPDCFGFYLELPCELAADKMLNNESVFVLGNGLRIRIHYLAFLRFALARLGEYEKIALGQMINFADYLLPEQKLAFNEIIVGEQGWLFLEQGSNSLSSQYTMPEHKAKNLGNAIAGLFRERAELARQKGIEYWQILVPEKTTMLMAKSGQALKTPTPLYSWLAREFKGQPYFVDLREATHLPEYWRPGDSHLSSIGALMAMRHLLKRLGLNIAIEPVNPYSDFVQGGLLNYLSNGSIYYEKVEYYENISCNGSLSTPILLEADDTPGKYVGTRLVFSNKAAPCAKKLLVFGNSFCGKTQLSTNFSWYFSRLFQNFTFVWQAGISKAEIEKTQPDIIICQTIERFLPHLGNTAARVDN